MVPLTPRPGAGRSRKGGTHNASLRIRQSDHRQRSGRRCSARAGAKREVLAGGTDLISLMKEDIETPERVVNIKGIKELGGITKHRHGRAHRRDGHHATNWRATPEIRAEFPVAGAGGARRHQPADPQHGHRRRRPLPAPSLLVLPQRLRPARPGKDGKAWSPNGENKYHAIFGSAARPISSARPASARRWSLWTPRCGLVSASGKRDVAVEKFFVTPAGEANESGDQAQRDPHRDPDPRRAGVRTPPTKSARKKRWIGPWPPLPSP